MSHKQHVSNNKYQPFTQVPHHDHDTDNDIELQSVPSTQPQQNSNNNNNNSNLITNLLKLTAHRRIRQQMDTIININDDSKESTNLITHHTSDIDSDASHAQSSDDIDTETADSLKYDDFVLLLYLDGTKKKVGIMNSWKIWNIKDEYFCDELKDGKKVRLIYRGKLLQDSMHLNTYNIASNGFIHVSISKNGNLFSHKYGTNGSSSSRTESTDVNYDNFDDGMDDEAMARSLQQRELELSQQRAQFPFSDFGANELNADETELDVNRARREFLCGMFLGSVAGIWILIFLILAQRNGGYSRRFRLGVTLGVAINLIIQLSYQVPGNPTSDENETETETEGHTDDSVPAVDGSD